MWGVRVDGVNSVGCGSGEFVLADSDMCFGCRLSCD